MAGMTRLLYGMALLTATVAAAAQTFVVPPELWDRPRSGRAVLEQPAIRQAVNTCLAQPGSRLTVRHATGHGFSARGEFAVCKGVGAGSL